MFKYFIILMTENRPCILQMFAKIVLYNGREPNIALLKLRRFSILKFYKKVMTAMCCMTLQFIKNNSICVIK